MYYANTAVTKTPVAINCRHDAVRNALLLAAIAGDKAVVIEPEKAYADPYGSDIHVTPDGAWRMVGGQHYVFDVTAGLWKPSQVAFVVNRKRHGHGTAADRAEAKEDHNRVRVELRNSLRSARQTGPFRTPTTLATKPHAHMPGMSSSR